MLEELTKHLSLGSEFCAIEHSPVLDVLNVLLLSKKQHEFHVTLKKQVNSLEALKSVISLKQSVYVIINNKTVISKTINGDWKGINAVKQAFQSLQITDFYWETITTKSQTIVSICRKTDVHNCVNNYEEKEFQVIGISLGNQVIQSLSPYIKDNNTIHTSNTLVNFEQNKINTIGSTELDIHLEYNIQGLAISNSFTLALGGIISYYTHTVPNSSNLTSYSEELRKKTTTKRIQSIVIKFGLFVLLGSLLINFMLFNYYQSNISLIQEQLKMNQSLKTQLNSLNIEVSKKKKITDHLLYSKTSKVSYYMDQIGSSLPSSILLNQLYYQPLKEKIKEDAQVKYREHIIVCEGFLNDSKAFTLWISELDKKPWVQQVHIVKFGTQLKQQSSFQLRIQLNEEN